LLPGERLTVIIEFYSLLGLEGHSRIGSVRLSRKLNSDGRKEESWFLSYRALRKHCGCLK
jgi:hypothetical protein